MDSDIPTIYYGTIADYRDIIDKYHNGELDYESYVVAFEKRAIYLKSKDRKEQLNQINKQILTNN